jgi:hypothetical protein
MATNLAIDERLLNAALEIGGKKTKKETVNSALKEFIARRKVKYISSIFGLVEYDKKFDNKCVRENR